MGRFLRVGAAFAHHRLLAVVCRLPTIVRAVAAVAGAAAQSLVDVHHRRARRFADTLLDVIGKIDRLKSSSRGIIDAADAHR